MKTQLLDLQSQTDTLRLKIKNKSRFNQFDQDWKDMCQQLSHLDGLLSRLCKSYGFSMNKFGRLI